MWPKLKEHAAGVEPVYVFDRKRPPGHLCQLTSEEIWKLQGRSVVDLNKGALMEQMVCEGCRATGAQSAASLLLWAGDVMEMIMEERATKAGMCAEVEGPQSLALKFWFGPANGEEETTGGEQEERTRWSRSFGPTDGQRLGGYQCWTMRSRPVRTRRMKTAGQGAASRARLQKRSLGPPFVPYVTLLLTTFRPAGRGPEDGGRKGSEKRVTGRRK